MYSNIDDSQPNPELQYEHKFKGINKFSNNTNIVILIGDTGVGKTCLLSKYCLI
jgi:flagellar biosynthesis GTPase FlhF